MPLSVFGDTQSIYYDEEKWSFFKIFDSVGGLLIFFCSYASPRSESEFDNLIYICKYWLICALSDTALERKQASTYIYTKLFFTKIPKQKNNKISIKIRPSRYLQSPK